MANRHANKRLLRAIRARMAATGERYQKAREAVLRQLGPGSERAARAGAAVPTMAGRTVELVEVDVSGRTVVLALIETPGAGPLFVFQHPLGTSWRAHWWRVGSA